MMTISSTMITLRLQHTAPASLARESGLRLAGAGAGVGTSHTSHGGDSQDSDAGGLITPTAQSRSRTPPG
eukprot:1333760-Rhodomonas_salina.2